jgi:hypothetical protein
MKMSAAAKPHSGQVWMVMCDSASSTTPVTPWPSPKAWKWLNSTRASAASGLAQQLAGHAVA